MNDSIQLPAEVAMHVALAKAKRAKVREITDEIKEHDAVIIEGLAGHEYGVSPEGEALVQYQVARAFDAEAAAAFLTDEQLAKARTVVDSKALKAMLTGEQLAQCMVAGTKRLVIK